MTHLRIQRLRRSAFTITEMLVATALTLFIMVVITTVFRAGTDTFSKLRTAGMLSENLQHATGILKHDVSAQHFDAPFDNRGGPYLSDQRLDLLEWQPPQKGYFEIRQDSLAQDDVPGAADADGLRSTAGTGTKLRFTVKLGTQRWTEQFSAFIPNVNTPSGLWTPSGDSKIGAYCNGNILFSPWAEISYFLTPTGDTTEGGALQLYTLRRRQRILSPTGETLSLDLPNLPAVYAQLTANTTSNQQVANTLGLDGTVHLSAWQNPPVPASPTPPIPVTLYGAGDVRNPFVGAPSGAAPQVWQNTRARQIIDTLESSDVLMVNVISFEVKVLWNADITGRLGPKRLSTYGAAPMSVALNTDYPYDNLPVYPDPLAGAPTGIWGNNSFYPSAVFDTWFTNQPPATVVNWDRTPATPASAADTANITNLQLQPPIRINVRALQFKIRIWDEKSQQARQVTIVQEV
jgi:hypothetical protein